MLLSQLCKTAAGGTPLKSRREFYEGGDIPWLLSGEVNNKNITHTNKFITKKGLTGSSAKIFPKNTVVIAMYGATAGEVGILRCEASTNQAVCGIYPNEKVLPEYLYYFFLNHKSVLVAQAVGNAQPNISQEKIKNTFIKLPLIDEQQRIVDILDKAFADIEKARVNAEQNLKNARELFDSYLQQVFSQRGEGWVDEPLSQCFKLRSGNNLTSKNMIAGDFPVFGGNEMVGTHNDFNLSGDNVIVGRVGALCGNARHIQQKVWLTDNAFKVVDFKYEFDHRFLTYMLNFKKLRNLARQAAQPVISNSSLKDLKLSFPISVSEQKIISARFDRIFNDTDVLLSVYQKKIEALGELKNSLLQKAFSGELTKSRGIAA